MNWIWANSLDHIWRWPAFPMWLALGAACFFGLILLITLLRAERSVANGALTVITLLAIGIAAAVTIRVYGPNGRSAPSEARAQPVVTAALPALSCIDDLAGDTVLAACEKTLFGSPDAVAAAVSYTAAQLTRLTALGNAAAATKRLTPDMKALRKALEHDRYGLVAQVLTTRDGCTQFDCAAFRSLTDRQQVAANMDAHLYDQLVARYASGWNAPASPSGALAALPQSMPTGKPTNAEFPSAASTPAVSIMSAEPGANAAARQATGTAAASTAAPRATAAQAAAPPASRKQPAPKAARAPVQIAPPAAAQAPAAADND